jgi:O-succinylbenzoate synthase
MKVHRQRRFSLPLRDGSQREILLLEFLTVDGRELWSEAAPWPGWSRESVSDLQAHLAQVPDRPGNFPSLQLAFELAATEADHWSDWPARRKEIPLNALLRGSAEEIRSSARAKFARGCHCFKLKTGNLPATELADLVRELARDLGGGVQFRLDPNRTWEFSQALEIARALADEPIEYFEEPLRDATRLPEFIARSPIPVALDETLREITPADLKLYQGASALVLKPTLLGSLALCREFAIAGQHLGLRAVVSSCFESGLTLYGLARLAANLPALSPCGFDPYDELLDDVLEPRWPCHNYTFHLPGGSPQDRIKR